MHRPGREEVSKTGARAVISSQGVWIQSTGTCHLWSEHTMDLEKVVTIWRGCCQQLSRTFVVTQLPTSVSYVCFADYRNLRKTFQCQTEEKEITIVLQPTPTWADQRRSKVSGYVSWELILKEILWAINCWMAYSQICEETLWLWSILAVRFHITFNQWMEKRISPFHDTDKPSMKVMAYRHKRVMHWKSNNATRT